MAKLATSLWPLELAQLNQEDVYELWQDEAKKVAIH
jgi:hypothetical protein